MSVRIPFTKIKPTGKVDLWDMLADDGPVVVELWAVDARHALDVDKDRWRLELPKNAKPGEAEKRRLADLAAQNELEGADPHYGAQQ